LRAAPEGGLLLLLGAKLATREFLDLELAPTFGSDDFGEFLNALAKRVVGVE